MERLLAFLLVCSGVCPVNALSGRRKIDILNPRLSTEVDESRGSSEILRHSNKEAINSFPIASESDVKEDYFKQKLDHFRPSDTRTFQQRYFYLDSYVQTSTSSKQIAFICVGGEGPPLDKSVLVDSPHCTGDMLETAKALSNLEDNDWNIHLYALEHRYYGESYPDNCFESGNSLDTENMVYLNSQQALRDLAMFCTHIMNSDTTWIAFGASYPGVLAAWSRLEFPYLIKAAVSNSAPLQVVLDFEAYKGHVAKALSDEVIGGSMDCLDVFRDGHEALAHDFEDPSKWDELITELNLCPDSDLSVTRNVEIFLGDGVYELYTQGNDPACTDPMCNIEKTCSAVLEQYNSTGSAKEALIWAVQQQRGEGSCINIDWDEMVDFMADPDQDREEGWRSWLWQTCTEVGFYQTCELKSSCPFARGYHPLSQDFELCSAAYALDRSTVYKAVEATNVNMGGWHLSASKILSVTGTVDPWTEMSLVANPHHEDDPEMPLLSVVGASHHYWTHEVLPTDDQAIQDARIAITEQVHEWLNEILQQPVSASQVK